MSMLGREVTGRGRAETCTESLVKIRAFMGGTGGLRGLRGLLEVTSSNPVYGSSDQKLLLCDG